MKKTVVLMLILLGIMLSGCATGSDGIEYIGIDYSTDEYDIRINIEDGSKANGVHISTETLTMHCDTGPDELIRFPKEAGKSAIAGAEVSIEAGIICDMGQERFDLWLAQLQPAQ